MKLTLNNKNFQVILHGLPTFSCYHPLFLLAVNSPISLCLLCKLGNFLFHFSPHAFALLTFYGSQKTLF